jgi:UDP-N-acetyl-D-mannosaminuronic acid dehydrogenase
VVGLGYVGLPVACLLAEKGFKVTGVDLKPDRVATISAGRSPIEGREPGLQELLAEVVGSGALRATTDAGSLASAEVVIVCVETPVDPADHRPRYEALKAACGSLAGTLGPGALVVIESTIAPGTMDRVVRPLFEGTRVVLGHCPERVMPGRLLQNLRTMSRAVGGETEEVAGAMASLYATYVEGELDLTDPLTAELVKTTENAYRDVNIAFANQVALICQEVGGDVWKVRELVNKSPGRNMLLPGAGVGGHCIPKDPWLLASALPPGHDATLIQAARLLNDGMPRHVARLVLDLLREEGVDPAGALVTVLGYAYLEESDDTRDSPTEAMLPHLRQAGCQVRVHDPFVGEHRGDLLAALAGADCAVLMVAHSEYGRLDAAAAAAVMRRPLVVDARAALDHEALRAAGIRFRTIGVGETLQPAPSDRRRR